MKKFLSLLAGLFAAICIALGQPPQHLNQNYQFKSVGADSSVRLPKSKAVDPNLRDTGMIYYSRIDKKIHWTVDSLRDTTFVPVASALSLVARNGYNVMVDSTIDPRFVVDASCIPEQAGTWTLNQPIPWVLLNHTTSHGSSFYDSVYGDASAGGLIVAYPPVKYVLGNVVVDDESFAGNNAFVGTTTGVSNFEAFCTQTSPVGLFFSGNGTTWTSTGNSGLAISAWNAGGSLLSGGTGITVGSGNPIRGVTAGYFTITYVGSNNYHIRQVFTALGPYDVEFLLVNNVTGADVTTAPTSADVVQIVGEGLIPTQVSLSTYSAANQWFGTNTNFFVRGMYELWMLGTPVDTANIYVTYQTNYSPGVTYHIYRATNKQFTGKVLAHTGTEGIFLDSGLATGHTYYYQYCPVVSGSDVVVTYCKVATLSQP
jgi:hypothetical protein